MTGAETIHAPEERIKEKEQTRSPKASHCLSRYLYRIQPVRSEALTSGFTDHEKQRVSEHFEYLKRLTEQGTVLLAGRTTNTDNSSFGIVIFNADSDDAARKIVDADPAVANRVFRAELFPYSNSLINNDSGKWKQ